jgi:hypothetical protein
MLAISEGVKKDAAGNNPGCALQKEREKNSKPPMKITEVWKKSTG